MPTSVGPDGIDVTGLGWTTQSTLFNSNKNLESYSGPVTTVTTPVLATGTAAVINAAYDTMLYIDITLGTSAVAVAMGPTAAAANTIFASATPAIGLMSVLVPASWFVKVTYTAGNVTFTAVTTRV